MLEQGVEGWGPRMINDHSFALHMLRTLITGTPRFVVKLATNANTQDYSAECSPFENGSICSTLMRQE